MNSVEFAFKAYHNLYILKSNLAVDAKHTKQGKIKYVAYKFRITP